MVETQDGQSGDLGSIPVFAVDLLCSLVPLPVPLRFVGLGRSWRSRDVSGVPAQWIPEQAGPVGLANSPSDYWLIPYLPLTRPQFLTLWASRAG